MCCRRRAMPGSAWRGRCASCSASAAARASAAGSANITAGTRFSISACRWRASSSWRWRCSLPEKRAEQNPPFDFFGLATFSLGMIGLQMLLDRGERLEWFRLDGNLGRSDRLGAGILSFHRARPDERMCHFLNKALFRDRNFVLSTIMLFAVGFVLLPTLALTSPMLEELAQLSGRYHRLHDARDAASRWWAPWR